MKRRPLLLFGEHACPRKTETEMSMIYVKNVPTWERSLRVLAGLGMLAAGGFLAHAGNSLGYALAGSGVMALLTGFFGFCPMCALAGRRLKAHP